MKLLAISMILRGVGWYLVGSGGGGGGSYPKKSFNRISIHIYLQSMFRLSFQSNAFKSIPYNKAYSSNLTN